MENKLETNNDEFKCKICNKNYKNRSGLWKHHTIKHNPPKSSISSSVSNNSSSNNFIVNDTQSKLLCIYCNKLFSRSDNLKRHISICKKVNNTTKSVVDLATENKLLKEHLKKQDEMMKKLMENINKNAKIHPKTLQKINKQLNYNNNTNSHNKMIINNTFVKFGNLSYDQVLTDKEQRNILRKQYMSLEESIMRIHFNKELPEYNNVFITNMKDDIAYVFNGKQFISVRKNEMLNQLVDMHIDEINVSFEKNKGKSDTKQIQR